jgi:adenine/guanine phosphoribosyltransferase-like PRPP-binding protein
VSKKETRHCIRTDYLDPVFRLNRYLPVVKAAIQALKKVDKKTPFDAIAFRGVSGAALAFPLSLALKKPLICIRKGASHYGRRKLEGCISAKTYIIVDDFIDSGHTVAEIIKEISKIKPNAVPVGIFLYAPTDSRREWKEGKWKLPIIRGAPRVRKGD